MRTTLLAPCWMLVLAAGAAGQVKVGEIVLATDESARGVSFEWPYAYVATFNDGWQHQVDLTDPANPLLVTKFNPSGGDVWNENLVFQGRLFAGFRFGGLAMWDVGGTPAELDTAHTIYHFAGLDVLPVPGRLFLLYSEHNAFTKRGGLRVFEFSSGTLVKVGESVDDFGKRDGRFLVATSDRWVYQLDAGAYSSPARPLNLNVYDLTSPANPVFCQMFDMGNTVGSHGGLEDLALHPGEDHLYAACGWDGLRILDISNRCAPVVVDTLWRDGFAARELSMLPGSVYLVASAVLPSGDQAFRVLDCAVPTDPVPVTGWLGDPGFTIYDLRAVSLPQGPAALVAGQDAGGDAVLQVWM